MSLVILKVRTIFRYLIVLNNERKVNSIYTRAMVDKAISWRRLNKLDYWNKRLSAQM